MPCCTLLLPRVLYNPAVRAVGSLGRGLALDMVRNILLSRQPALDSDQEFLFSQIRETLAFGVNTLRQSSLVPLCVLPVGELLKPIFIRACSHRELSRACNHGCCCWVGCRHGEAVLPAALCWSSSGRAARLCSGTVCCALARVAGTGHSQGWQGSGSLDEGCPITWGSLTLPCLMCGQELCLVAVGSGDGRAVVLSRAPCQHRITPCPGGVLLTCQTKISLCSSRVQLFLPRNRLCCLCPQTSSCTTCGGTWGGKGLLLALMLRC